MSKTLQDYTTQELKAELRRRSDLIKAEKAKLKRCRMCKHWGIVDLNGKPLTDTQRLWMQQLRCSKPCKFSPLINGKRHKLTRPSQLACEHFEPINQNNEPTN